MKSRLSLILLILAVSAFISVNFLPLTKAEANQPNKQKSATKQINNQVANSTNLTETKPLTAAQKAIPDEIAFEVFLRTVGENNARQLLLEAGFDKNKDFKIIFQLMNDAKSFSENLEILDKRAKEIKTNKDGGKNFLADTEVINDLASLQSDKTNIIQQYISRNLQNTDRFENGWEKLRNYVQTKVKSQMQVVETKSSSRSKQRKKDGKDVAIIKTSAEKSATQTQVGNAYLYSTSWSESENIFGSGTITEQYQSSTSYVVSVTVRSPSGRTNTTNSDWNYATLSNSTGLSLELEDGTYNIQATFEADAGGYYDEWGNYYSYGSYPIGNSANTSLIDPYMSVLQLGSNQNVIVNQPNANFNIISTVSYSSNVPMRTTYDAGLLLAVNGGSVSLTTASPSPSPTGALSNISNNNREYTVTKLTTNQIQQLVLSKFTINQNSQPALITFEYSITNAVSPNGSPIAIRTQARTTEVRIAAASPTPTPNPPIIAGGCGACGYAGLGCSGCAVYGASGTYGGCQYPFFNHNGCCCQGSPIVLDIDGNGFAMTNGANGVSFDLGGDGINEQTSWTAASSDDAWLAVDRNNNHTIDNGKELFGNYCDQPAPPAGTLRNGFSGLAEFDKAENGGNGDGKITRADNVFRKLRLWQDKNHNGISEPEELSKLPALDVVALFLDYQESRRTDEFGNRFKFRARVRDRIGARVGRWAWDVFVVPPQAN